VPVRDPKTPSSANDKPPCVFAVLGGTKQSGIAKPTSTIPMLDEKGRVWITSRIRPKRKSILLQRRSGNPSAVLFPLQDLVAGNSLCTDSKDEAGYAH